MGATTVAPSKQFDYYQNKIYWNSFEAVRRVHNKLISGDPAIYWRNHLLKRYGRRNCAFVFNCGNGWVERDLFQHGVIARVIAFDINEKYVSEARAAAQAIGLPAEYFAADVNTFDGDDLRCDLIVNVGAMHHVAYINRMTAKLAKRLTQNELSDFSYLCIRLVAKRNGGTRCGPKSLDRSMAGKVFVTQAM